MTTRLKIELLSEWHCGTGLGSGPDLDAEVVKTPGGMPTVPGRTLKGLLRDAMSLAEQAGVFRGDATYPGVESYFGTDLSSQRAQKKQHSEVKHQETRFESKEGTMLIDSAVLGENSLEERAWERWGALHPIERGVLYRAFASTALDENGVAMDKTLRSIEAVVPLCLYAPLRSVGMDAVWKKHLTATLPFLDDIGSGRTRGFGRATVSLVDDGGPTETPPLRRTTTSSLAVRYVLESDVSLSNSSATAGGHETLPYLSGSAILGAVARALYQHDAPWTMAHDWDLFFSGRVRFSDATLEGRRPVPLALQFVKGEDTDVLHNLARSSPLRAPTRPRDREWICSAGTVTRPRRRHSMRTAIEPTAGRARDGHLFEIDSLERGQEFYGKISVDEDTPDREEVVRRLERALSEPLRIGRSSRQEFGRVRAELITTEALPPFAERQSNSADGRVVIWCVSDCALVDPNGGPTVKPDPTMFHLPEGSTWDPERSFLMVRRWAPFRDRKSATSPLGKAHAKRPSAERIVLRGGSVLVFRVPPGVEPAALRKRMDQGIGLYRSEGLGNVHVEPELLAGASVTLHDVATSRPSERAASAGIAAELESFMGAPCTDDSRRVSSWMDSRVLGLAAGESSWRLAHEWLKRVKNGGKVPYAQWGELRQKVLGSADPLVAVREVVAGHSPEPTRSAVYGEKKHEGRGGVGKGRQAWRQDVAQWLPGRVEQAIERNGPVVVRQALLTLAVEAVRLGRAPEEHR